MRRPPPGPPPPRRLRAVLAALMPGPVGGAALDDLDREWRQRHAAGSGPSAAWYVFEGLRVVVHLRVSRLAGQAGPRSAPDLNRRSTMDRLSQDLRFALRRLRRNPGFALAAVLTLALGVGANVAVFSVVDAVLLEPLPYEEPDELVAVWEWHQPRDRRGNVANPGNVRAWREGVDAFESVAATVVFDQTELLRQEDGATEVQVRLVTPGFFDVLGVDAALGRTFSTDAEDDGIVEVLLAHRFWRTHFGSDPSVLGRSLTLGDGDVGVVVGVLPPAYMLWGEESDVWASFALRGDQTTTGRYLNTVARLADGATVEQAQQELEAVAAGLREAYPEFNAGWSAHVVPLGEQVVGDADRVLWVLLGAVALLLLIACANVSNLFLARATGRQREMAVRSSLGAGRGTLAAQLLVEGGVVAAVGSAVGVVVAYAATRAVAVRLPDAFDLPRVDTATVDGRVLAFAVGVAALTTLLFGLVPALRGSSAAPAETLNAEGRGPGRSSGRMRSALVVAEVALSVVLLVGAGLLVRSVTALLSQDLGVEPENLVVARVSMGTADYRDGGARARFLDELTSRAAAIPGVEAAGSVPFLPLDGMGSATSYWAGDRPQPPAEERPVTDVRNVAGDWFDAMGVRLLAGRAFDGRDGADAPRVAVVNRALAEEVWPGEDPLGRPLVISWNDPPRPAEVVGVVEDVRNQDLQTEPRATAYFPYAQFPSFGVHHLAVRSRRSPAELQSELERALHAVDPSLTLGEPRTMESVVGRSAARPRMTALLMAVFAAVAAALAGVGLYGVLSYAVSRRSREIGVRVALGARPRAVLGRVVREGMVLVAGGLAIGVVAALAASRAMEALLYRVEPSDPWAVGGSVAFLATVALAACLVPAWRATRIQPAEALRAE